MCSSSAPDTSGMQQAALNSSQLSRDAFTWFQQQYADTAPQRDAATARDNAIAQEQLKGMQFANTDAAALQARRKQTEGREDQMIADAQGYDSPERRAAARAEAAAGVQSAYGQQQQAQNRAFARQGMDLTGPQAAALQQQAGLSAAKATAGATYGADRNVEQQGYARKMDAIGLTKGVVGAQATQQGIATNAGTAAAGATGSGLQATYSGTPMMQAGFNTALNGQQIAGNLYGQQAQLQKSGGGDFGSSLAGVGAIMQGAGALYAASSKSKKMDKAPASDEQALEAVNAVPVENWQYKPGQGDEGQHIGPYAEDVQAKMGDKMAPGGQVINLTDLAKNNAAAIQALTAEVAQLEEMLAAKGNAKGSPKPKSDPKPKPMPRPMSKAAHG